MKLTLQPNCTVCGAHLKSRFRAYEAQCDSLCGRAAKYGRDRAGQAGVEMREEERLFRFESRLNQCPHFDDGNLEKQNRPYLT